MAKGKNSVFYGYTGALLTSIGHICPDEESVKIFKNSYFWAIAPFKLAKMGIL